MAFSHNSVYVFCATSNVPHRTLITPSPAYLAPESNCSVRIISFVMTMLGHVT